MNDSETRRLEMFIRVRQFGASRPKAFPAGGRGAEVLAQLGEVVTQLEAQAAAESSGKRASKEGTAQKATARAAPREDLEAISRTARAMALSAPGLDDKFRLPRNVGDQAWLAAARSIASDAAPLSAEFIRRGLPSDFIEDLSADINALEGAINSGARGTGARVAAGAAIDDAVERGTNAVRESDAIMLNVLRDDPAGLAAWASASHTERAPRRAPAKAPAAQPAQPSA